jgi:hypothetical protein
MGKIKLSAPLQSCCCCGGQINNEPSAVKTLFPQPPRAESETQITVTTAASTMGGIFISIRRDRRESYVNGVQLIGGSLAVTLNPKRTATYKITMPGSVIVPGFVMAIADNTDLDVPYASTNPPQRSGRLSDLRNGAGADRPYA